MNAKKMEVIVSVCKGSESVNLHDRSGERLNRVCSFKYLSSVISEDGGCVQDVKARVRAAWMKFRDMSGIVCDRNMPERLWVKVYKTVIRRVFFYGCELWAVRKCEKEKILNSY